MLEQINTKDCLRLGREEYNYYQRLGLPAGASPEVIQQRFDQIQAVLSESVVDSEESATSKAYRNIREAYENLIDDTKRNDYLSSLTIDLPFTPFFPEGRSDINVEELLHEASMLVIAENLPESADNLVSFVYRVTVLGLCTTEDFRNGQKLHDHIMQVVLSNIDEVSPEFSRPGGMSLDSKNMLSNVDNFLLELAEARIIDLEFFVNTAFERHQSMLIAQSLQSEDPFVQAVFVSTFLNSDGDASPEVMARVENIGMTTPFPKTFGECCLIAKQSKNSQMLEKLVGRAQTTVDGSYEQELERIGIQSLSLNSNLPDENFLKLQSEFEQRKEYILANAEKNPILFFIASLTEMPTLPTGNLLKLFLLESSKESNLMAECITKALSNGLCTTEESIRLLEVVTTKAGFIINSLDIDDIDKIQKYFETDSDIRYQLHVCQVRDYRTVFDKVCNLTITDALKKQITKNSRAIDENEIQSQVRDKITYFVSIKNSHPHLASDIDLIINFIEANSELITNPSLRKKTVALEYGTDTLGYRVRSARTAIAEGIKKIFSKR